MTIPLLDAQVLAAELKSEIRGEVRFDDGSRALYATDASNYRQVPIGVVIPESVDDVIVTVAACRRYGAPVLSRGGGTSLAGQCCNVAVVMDMSKYLNRIIELDPEKKIARVEPGCVLDSLRDAAEKHHLTFAPDPSTHSHNTLGGMIGNNSCGVHSVMGGKTVDNVISLDVLLYDGTRMTVGKTDAEEFARISAAGGRRGEIYAQLKALCDREADRIRARYPKIPRRVSGYNLTICCRKMVLTSHGLSSARKALAWSFSRRRCALFTARLAGRSWYSAIPMYIAQAIMCRTFSSSTPIGLEGMDDRLLADMKAIGLHPEDCAVAAGGRWLAPR